MDKQTPDKMKFSSLRDHFNTASMALAAQAPYFYALSLRGSNDFDPLTHAAIIGGVFAALRVKYLREVPLFLTRLVLLPLVMRKAKPAPEYIQKMVDDMVHDVGHKSSPRVYVYERGVTRNAMAFGSSIFIGQTLVDKLSQGELKFVLAHELSHLKAQDISERYLTTPPVINSFFAFVGTAVNVFSGGMNALHNWKEAGAALVVTGAYFMYEKNMFQGHSRYTEYRADKNALLMTRDVSSALSGLNKIGVDIVTPSNYERFNSSHPRDRDRLDYLVKIYNENVGKCEMSYSEYDYKLIIVPPSSPAP